MSEQTSGGSEIAAAIKMLEAAIDAVKRGDLDGSVSVPFDGDHPLGALAEAINDMANALATTRATRHAHEIELETRLGVIGRQRAAIAELSSPVIEVWHGVLTLPIIGPVDAERATAMTANLLEAVMRVHAAFVIVDVTGMHGVGADVSDHLVRLVRCVRLLGSEAVLSGMRPDVARGIVEVGGDTTELRSFPTLRAALASYVGPARMRTGTSKKPLGRMESSR